MSTNKRFVLVVCGLLLFLVTLSFISKTIRKRVSDNDQEPSYSLTTIETSTIKIRETFKETTTETTEIVTKETAIYEPITFNGYTDKELIALIAWAEAGNQSELGKRLVIDVILNRVDSSRFPNSVSGVIFQSGQFDTAYNCVQNSIPDKDILRLVAEEMNSRTNSEVLYFRTNHYFSWATPVLSEGAHYFSK